MEQLEMNNFIILQQLDMSLLFYLHRLLHFGISELEQRYFSFKVYVVADALS